MLIEPVASDISSNRSFKSTESKMNKFCRQWSIESPATAAGLQDCVFKCEVPVPDVPPQGARIKIVCAGACYRSRSRSSSTSSTGPLTPSEESAGPAPTPTYDGVRDTGLFPGFEAAGIIDALGSDVSPNDRFTVGQRVVIHPHDTLPDGYADYIVVKSLADLVAIPDNVSLSVAAMLPSGALWAKNAVLSAMQHVDKFIQERPNTEVKILIVGTGGLALWTMRIAAHYCKSPKYKDLVKVTIASLKDDGFKLAKEIQDVNVVQWNENVYESQIIERTKDACCGFVDIVIDFSTTSRSLHRSLQCLNHKGVVLVNEDVASRLLPKFSSLADERNQHIIGVSKGSIQQLRELVNHVSQGEIVPPPHSEFAADEAPLVIQKLGKSEIQGRAILRFDDVQ